MNAPKYKTRVIIVAIALLALVILTGFIDTTAHFSPLIVIAIMLIATIGAAQFLAHAQE